MYLGPTGDPLPQVTEARRLRLRPGDSLAVRLDREPGEYEAHEIAARIGAVTGVPVVVLGPSADIEVIGPEAAARAGGWPGDELLRWLQAEVRRRGGVAAVFT